jgi:hypothetical protein
VTEAELRRAVEQFAGQLGVRWIYLGSDTRRQQGHWRGAPDLFLCGTQACCWRELKAPGKHPRSEQRDWHELLAAAGQDIAVWKPGDLLSGRVAEELAALNGTGRPEPAGPLTSEERMWRALRRAAERQDTPR